MKTLFNDSWVFSEYEIDYNSMFEDGEPILFTPDQFYEKQKEQEYKSVSIPHDWMIYQVQDLYKNSVGFYKKEFKLSAEQVNDRHNAIRFEGVYMNSGVWVNGKKAGEWKYGYSTFEFDISDLIKEGDN
jgi:beta-galactosidase